MTFTLGRVARFPPGEGTGMSALIDEGGRGGGLHPYRDLLLGRRCTQH